MVIHTLSKWNTIGALGMTTCYLIRHAAKERGAFFNPVLRHQDEPISAPGQIAAQKICAYFAGKAIAAIYISEYQRTRQTSEPLAQQLQLTPIVDARLNEIDNGRLDGMTDEQIQQTYPDVWRAFLSRSADFRFPAGETGAEAQQRIVEFLEEKRRQHHNENIILVSHEGLIRLLTCAILDLPVYKRWNFHYDFCGITEITYQPEYAIWKLIRFNQVCG
jgi:broad specificity phosphatase PhoE